MNHRRLYCWLCYALASWLTACGWLFVAQSSEPAKPKPAASLDDELLQGLGGEKPAAKSSAPTKKPSVTDLDDALLEGLGGEKKPVPKKNTGEGVQPAANDVIGQLTEQMRAAQELLRRSQVDTQLQPKQDEIVRRMNDLIEELKQRQQQQQSSGSSSKNKPQGAQQRQQVSQPKSSSGPSQQQAAQQPARDSSDELKQRQANKIEQAKMQEMLKEIWGQLPQRVREQMLQAGAEKFLPKYELLIEQYFKTLAERQNADQP